MFPWRPGGGDFKRHDKDTHDRHGIPRCQHCGAPTSFVRFEPGDQSKPEEKRNPRLWVDCMAGATEKCAKTQTISCTKDYRLLVPLWRTDPLYHELKESHGSYEAQHDWWRDRYKVAADDLGLRPKIRDIDFHRPRANVGRSSTGYASASVRAGSATPSATARAASGSSKSAGRASPGSSRRCWSGWA